MSWRIQGIGASPGRVMGPVRSMHRDLPPVPHRTISPEEVEEELERFQEARARALERTRQLGASTEERLGEVEANVFEPQEVMLEDPDLVEGTMAYVRENFLSAERAFEWRLLEIRSRFLDSPHAMVKDRLADLRDIRYRVLSELLDEETPARETLHELDEPVVLAFEELTPSFAVDLDPRLVRGLLAATGSRASHSAVLARSMEIPAVVGVGERIHEVADGSVVILDGSTGRVVVDPTEDEVDTYRRSVQESTARQERLEQLARLPDETADGVEVTLQVNLDQPDDVEDAVRVRPSGVGLFRSEFLVIGRRTIPGEEQQYEAYRRVVEAFPEEPVTLRTFDIGGDKFPIFLQTSPEENPYLGWRAIRVCLDRPDLFRNQLRAAVRASRHGRMRLLLPFVTSVDEVRRTRDLLREVCEELGVQEEEGDIPLGMMVETPSAVETLDLLAPHVDYLSLGTNDLTQYVLAVDRGSARLAERYDPLHPALFRTYRRVRRTAEEHGLEVGVCGDVATDPLGLAALLGLGYREFSLPVSAYLEMKEWVRAVKVGELEEICGELAACETPGEVRAPLRLYLEGTAPGETTRVASVSRPV